MFALIVATAMALASPTPLYTAPAVDAGANQAFVGVRIPLPRSSVAPPIDGNLSDPAWAKAAKVTLDFNLRTHERADQATTVYLLTDTKYLYVGADARQRQPLQATQHTNDVALENDDYFEIDLWPGGANGFAYEFSANPIGTHN